MKTRTITLLFRNQYSICEAEPKPIYDESRVEGFLAKLIVRYKSKHPEASHTAIQSYLYYEWGIKVRTPFIANILRMSEI